MFSCSTSYLKYNSHLSSEKWETTSKSYYYSILVKLILILVSSFKIIITRLSQTEYGNQSYRTQVNPAIQISEEVQNKSLIGQSLINQFFFKTQFFLSKQFFFLEIKNRLWQSVWTIETDNKTLQSEFLNIFKQHHKSEFSTTNQQHQMTVTPYVELEDLTMKNGKKKTNHFQMARKKLNHLRMAMKRFFD